MSIDRLRGIFSAVALLATVTLAASPARADRCDDLARQLKSQIDGLSVGRTAANVIYLSHPAAKQLRLGCASRNFSNELYAASATRKPAPALHRSRRQCGSRHLHDPQTGYGEGHHAMSRPHGDFPRR